MLLAQAAKLGSGLNWVDVAGLLVLAAFFVYGVLRGFMLQLAGIAVLVGSLVLASLLSGPAGEWLRGRFTTLTETTAKYVAFGVILLLGLAIGTAVSHLVRGALDKAKLLAYDRLLGGLLGAVKGVILLIVVLQLALNLTLAEGEEPEGLPASLVNSKTGRLSKWTTQKLLVFLPADMSRKLEKYDRLNRGPRAPSPPGRETSLRRTASPGFSWSVRSRRRKLAPPLG